MKRGIMTSIFRLFTIQGSWSYERLQGIGMAVCVEPLLRDLPGGVTGDAYRKALARAAGYFNTHPYLAGLAVGATARAEHDGMEGGTIERLRSALKGPLGAIGDRLVWTGVLPLCSALGLSLAVLWNPLAGVVGFLGLFNVVHVALRGWSVPTGWNLGGAVARALQHPWIQRGSRTFEAAAVLAMGFALPVVGGWLAADLAPGAKIAAGASSVAAAVVFKWLLPTGGAARIGAAAIALALGAGWLWP